MSSSQEETPYERCARKIRYATWDEAEQAGLRVDREQPKHQIEKVARMRRMAGPDQIVVEGQWQVGPDGVRRWVRAHIYGPTT